MGKENSHRRVPLNRERKQVRAALEEYYRGLWNTIPPPLRLRSRPVSSRWALIRGFPIFCKRAASRHRRPSSIRLFPRFCRAKTSSASRRRARGRHSLSASPCCSGSPGLRGGVSSSSRRANSLRKSKTRFPPWRLCCISVSRHSSAGSPCIFSVACSGAIRESSSPPPDA